jgi:hypothetical protein
MKSDFIEGDEWGTYVALETSSSERNAGSPKGREPYGDGTPVVVRGGESPLHGEGG